MSHLARSISDRPGLSLHVLEFPLKSDSLEENYAAVIEQITSPSDQLDLAVLRVIDAPDDVQPLEVFADRLSRNTAIRVIGHPYTSILPWTAASGEVLGYSPNNPWMPLAAYVAEGNSGGPVINEQRQIVGMMVRIQNETDIATDPNQATPIVENIQRATGDLGLAYRIEIVLQQLRQWNVLE